MASKILSNKTNAKLYIVDSVNDGEVQYQQVNPETLAEMVVDKTDNEEEIVTKKNVQQHIDDEDIHFSRSDFNDLTEGMITIDNLVLGNGLSINELEDSKTYKLNLTNEVFTTRTVKNEDGTIKIKEVEDGVVLSATLPDIEDIENVITRDNIKADDESVIIRKPDGTKDVYISAKGKEYKAGDGIEITDDYTINNILPDVEIQLEAGKNVKVEGQYPNFIISASSGATVVDWTPNENFFEGQFVVYQNSIFRCKENHTSGSDFEIAYWDLIAGYSINRYYYLNEDEEMTSLELPMIISNKGVLTINVGGIILQAQNYDIEPNGKTVTLHKSIPMGEIVEVSVMGNEVVNQYDNGVNIELWKSNVTYGMGNVVIYHNSLYQCLSNHISAELFDDSKWKLICGYVKTSNVEVIDGLLETIELPEIVYDITNIIINVDGKILQKDEYTLDSDGLTIRLLQPMDNAHKVETTVLHNSVLAQLNLPLTNGHSKEFLRVSETGLGYELITEDILKDQLNIRDLTTFNGNANKFVSVNDDETGFEYKTLGEISGSLGVRKIAEGLSVSQFDGIITVESGSIVSDDGNLLIKLNESLRKKPNKAFGEYDEENNASGLAYDYSGETYTFPIMTDMDKPFDQVYASDELADYEAWRAMDIYGPEDETAPGWRTRDSVTDAYWYYVSSNRKPLKIKEFDIYGTKSYGNNRPKNVEVFIGAPSNVIQRFTLPNVDLAHEHIVLDRPQWSTTFGLHFVDSYGSSLGMKHIVLNGLYPTFTTRNMSYSLYLISNDDCSMVDVMSVYDNDFELPLGFTHKAKIGSFKVDDNSRLYDVYPPKDLPTTFLEGMGVLDITNGRLETWTNNNGYATKVVEQWGQAPSNTTRVLFPQSFKHQCFYVDAGGREVKSLDKDGFQVSSGNSTLYWHAKGY